MKSVDFATIWSDITSMTGVWVGLFVGITIIAILEWRYQRALHRLWKDIGQEDQDEV